MQRGVNPRSRGERPLPPDAGEQSVGDELTDGFPDGDPGDAVPRGELPFRGDRAARPQFGRHDVAQDLPQLGVFWRGAVCEERRRGGSRLFVPCASLRPQRRLLRRIRSR